MSSDDPAALSLAAFTALGTIVGYVGTEVASSSIFDRVLWPSRFWNIVDLKSSLATAFYHPAGGPIHKAAVDDMNRIVRHGLLQGYCRGDMLGTVFFEDSGQSYRTHTLAGPGPTKEVRNVFWLLVLSRIPWKPLANSSESTGEIRLDDELAQKAVVRVKAQRPIHVLRLGRAPTSDSDPKLSVVDGDVGSFKGRYKVGVVASEIITLGFGIVSLAVWQSPFSSWYATPLLLKLVALAFAVRRTTVDHNDSEKDSENTLYEITGISKGFMLIHGPWELVNQFFRHYGHPIRSRKGISGDRVREVIGITVVNLFALIYPGGLITFIFAPAAEQWLWLGYQLVTVIAMHLYRFTGGEKVGMTQTRIAMELAHTGAVCFNDGGGNKVIARLTTSTARSVADGRREVDPLIQQILREDR